MSLIESLALFPLSDVVLLPEVSVPLYIFEPRYRQMTQDALRGSHQIGMVTVRPDAVSAMAGDPRIFRTGCLGRIAQAQEHPDGTFHILLLGERRFRILEEHAREGDRMYRSARVELLDDRPAEGAVEQEALLALRGETLAQLERLIATVSPGAEHERILEGFERLEAARLINALSQAISFDPVERQQLLEADTIVARFEILRDLLRFRLAELGSQGSGSASLPN
jgi:Lon protease-like protein